MTETTSTPIGADALTDDQILAIASNPETSPHTPLIFQGDTVLRSLRAVDLRDAALTFGRAVARAALAGAAQPPAIGGDPAEPRDDSDRTYDRPIGYLPASELWRLHAGHDANLRSAKFGPSTLDRDVPVYLDAALAAAPKAAPALEPLPPPGVHAAAHYATWLRREAHAHQEPKAGALRNAARMIEVLTQEARRLHQELIEAQQPGAAPSPAAQGDVLGFELEQRGGVFVVQFDDGGCRPASPAEVALWEALQRAGRARQ